MDAEMMLFEDELELIERRQDALLEPAAVENAPAAADAAHAAQAAPEDDYMPTTPEELESMEAGDATLCVNISISIN